VLEAIRHMFDSKNSERTVDTTMINSEIKKRYFKDQLGIYRIKRIDIEEDNLRCIIHYFGTST
jgi:hypothetical protein